MTPSASVGCAPIARSISVLVAAAALGAACGPGTLGPGGGDGDGDGGSWVNGVDSGIDDPGRFDGGAARFDGSAARVDARTTSVDGSVVDPPEPVVACDVLVVGGGMGGVAAAHEAASAGVDTCLVESDTWLGGQPTTQGTPFDQTFYGDLQSLTYADMRRRIRQYYLDNYAVSSARLTNDVSDGGFDPGTCWVSALCHEPKVARTVIEDQLLAPLVQAGTLQIIKGYRPVSVARSGNTVTGVTFAAVSDGASFSATAAVTIDATELGDLLPLAGAGYRMGAESRSETGEPDAPATGNSECVQPFTYVFALENRPAGEDNRIPMPAGYVASYYALWDPWLGHVFAPRTGTDMSFWNYRRMLDARNFTSGVPYDVAMINWGSPTTGGAGGNDFNNGCGADGCNLLDKSPDAVERILARGREHALGFLYWLQNDVPRDDGGYGYPNLKLRTDTFDTYDGLSRYPYIREARRLRALTLIRQQDVASQGSGAAARPAVFYDDSVGIGRYFLDLHPCAGGPQVAITVEAGSGQVPLGALIPETLDGLLAGAKNIGATHITNGMYRLHPVEWNIGQAAGATAAFAVSRGVSPRAIRADTLLLRQVQLRLITGRGGPLYWWTDLARSDAAWVAAQMVAVAGVMRGDNTLAFNATSALTRAQAAALAVRVFGITAVTACHASFTDVPCSNAYYGFVQALADRGVTTGTGGGAYSPDLAITRAHFATFLVRSACSPSWSESACPLTRPSTASYSDVPTSDGSFAYVETARARGWLAGEADGSSFNPTGSLTRRAAALWLWNVLRGELGL